MKILKLILENFTNISTAMSANKVTIDFSKSENPICLLIGPNGSGKTTILSLLHPFATLGNLDVRDGHELILSGENGYKEIHIGNGSNVYIIKHYYTPNSRGTHNVKSFIMLNGEELNPNGNVSSFKEIIKDELDVELDFLKLIRLGNNVTSLISLTETERKNFMSKLLDDVGIYLQLHKKVNLDLRELKDMMSHDDDKLKRLGIKDADDANNELDKLTIALHEEESLERSIRSRLSVLDHELSKVESFADIKDDLKLHKKKLSKMEDTLHRKTEDGDSLDPSIYASEINKLESEKIRAEDSIETSKTLIKEYTSTLDNLYTQLHDKKVRLNQELESDKELQRMDENINEIERKISKADSLLENFSSKCELSDFESLLVFLKTINDTIKRCYDFGMEPVKAVTKLMREKKNVQSFVSSHLINMADDSVTSEDLLKSITRGIDLSKSSLCENDGSCPALKLYKKVRSLTSTSDTKSEKRDKDFYTYMDLIYKILINALPQFSDYKEIISTLPKHFRSMFTEESIYNAIDAGGDIYDKKLFQDYYSLLTEYTNKLNLEKTLEELRISRSKFSQLSNLGYLEKEIEELEDNLEAYNTKVKHENNLISENREKITDISRTLEELIDIKDAIDNYDSEMKEVTSLTEKKEMYEENYQRKVEEERNLQKVVESVSSLRRQIQMLTSSIDQYLAIKKELRSFNKIFDEMTLVKSSLSSKNGIPLYYIDMYLGNTEELTNELLDIAYNGKIYIDNFKLTATEFAIPYFNKGKRISDVRLASSGELAFLSLALSFALASQAISKYNIMLLDEVDATLDQSNREKFIQILERQIEIIDSEQNFLITHNNMFSSYPVDIIDLSFNDVDENGVSMKEKYPLANFIEIIRE